jgi:hypothetical protein
MLLAIRRLSAIGTLGLALCAYLGVQANASPPPPHVASTKRCGSLPLDYSPTPEEHYNRMYVRATRSVNCATAKRVILRYQHHHGGCLGSSCFRSYPDGWRCDASTPGGWPVIMECVKGEDRVRAHVRSSIKGPR